MSAADPARWAALSPRLDELLTLPPLERAARLDEIAANDPGTAARLRDLLHARDEASRVGFLGGVADATALPVTASVGDALGAWTLVEPIGEGGMGSVWRARRNDGRFEGEAAVKLLRTGLFDPAAQARFRREGAILARLQHPGIAQLLDAGVTPRGQPYLVLELVRGERIDAWCDARSLDVPARVALFLQVLDAVAAAHARLVIHRDLKPSNILVDGEGRVRLLDFGVARLLDEEADAALTRDGAVAMTPRYAAPEQFRGGDLSMATDVFALGVVLHELLTGVHPSGLATDAAPLDYLAAATAGPTRAASQRAPGRRQALRGDLDNIVAKSLRADAAARYASATALAEDLRAHLQYRPVSARPDAPAYRLAKFLRRNRVGAALGALALAATVAGVAGTWAQARRAAAQAVQAQQERDRALRELDHAELASQFVGFLLTEGGDKPARASELLARAAGMVERQFGSDGDQRARLLALVSAQYGELGDLDKARPLLLAARQAAGEAGSTALMLDLDCAGALLQLQLGQAEAALPVLDRAVAALRATPGADTIALARCLDARAQVQHERAQEEAALADARAALALIGDPRPAQRLVAIRARSSLAPALSRLGRVAEAVAEQRRVVADVQSSGLGETAMAAVMLHNLAAMLSNAGQDREAADVTAEAVQIEQRIQGEAVDPSSIAMLADLLSVNGRDAEAARWADLAMTLALRQPGSSDRGWTAVRTASVHCAGGRLARCGELLAQGRREIEPGLRAGHPTRALLDVLQARLDLLQGRLPAAASRLERALAVYAQSGTAPSGRLRALLALSQCERRLGHTALARASVDEALPMARRFAQGFEHSTHLGMALLEDAAVRLAEGDRATALASAQQALAQFDGSLGPEAPARREAQALLAGLVPR